MESYFEANRLNWDNRAELHSTDTTGRYRIAPVLAGGSSLHALETGEIGDITGRDIVHLQCHIGLDTISLKHLGAKSVTGLDFSPKAIAAARDFAARAGTDVRFVEASLYDAPAALGETYDMAFVTWGAINWLPDIEAWARVISSLLRPGGRLYLLEGHPGMNQLDLEGEALVTRYGWRTPVANPLVFDEAETYTGDERKLTHTRNYEWIHPISSIVNGLIGAGMQIYFLNEHELVVWKAFPNMIEVDEDTFALPPEMPRIPLSFSLGATKTK